MFTLPARYGRWVPILAPLALVFLFLHLHSSLRDSAVIVEPAASNQREANKTEVDISSACRPLPGIEDVLVILKTGITEAQDKVPVHVRTTLRCIPHKLIVSDYEEDIAGLRTRDVFHNASASMLSSDDFAIYHRARSGGRAGLLQQDHTKVANGPSGMMDNPGWKLDKWKFLPMVQEARAYRPEAKWFVFLEADTYPIWTNLLAWLAQFDAERQLYIGNQMQIGESMFAHGGSGFVLSNSAIHNVADLVTKYPEEWEKITNAQWAGDCVLGMALSTIHISLVWSWPHVTTESVWGQDALGEGFGKKQWCHPPFTFHHMSPADVDRMWDFDQKWFSNENHTVLHYGDIFTHFVRPTLAHHLDNWDNYARDEYKKKNSEGIEIPMTVWDCAEHCASDRACLQYRFSDGKCYTSPQALRGTPAPGVESGTLMWRVDAAVAAKEKCEKPFPIPDSQIANNARGHFILFLNEKFHLAFPLGICPEENEFLDHTLKIRFVAACLKSGVVRVQRVLAKRACVGRVTGEEAIEPIFEYFGR
ncbi:hypothetical protein N7532_005119 [Penicillium argentinense]|uniref:N-acetylgalactosaminide beta-1,3-galactosyltransferase n=1 Tax=Penicillium argentinense TaxID=1131581 RepID=A0A9W9FDA5_9EURO|nr:uncharacterized protein N7532_005119 [Penicillium argentinense]KAJ5098118.1 hypothetical protein N7532_005119 [Penicillium argentinense]